MTAFDTAWAIVKNMEWGEGFRVHGFDPSAPAVTELVHTKYPAKPGGFDSMHTMSTGRGSGTGVSGTYYHGGPFDPLWSTKERGYLANLQNIVERNPDHGMVYIPPPKKALATTPKFRDMSMKLLGNVRDEIGSEGYGHLSRLQGRNHRGEQLPPYEWFQQATTPKKTYRSGTFNTQPARAAQPKTWEDRVDLMASPYTRNFGSYWRNMDDLVGAEDEDNRLGGDILIENDRNNRLFDYLGRTPLVRGIMGSDIGDIDDEEYNWMNDPEVLEELGARMRDTGGLSPMNILLGERGHDAVVPINPRDRGMPTGDREVTEGSVLLPPAVEGWDVDYHPMESGRFEPLEARHIGRWLDEFDRTKEITDMTDRGKRMGDVKW